VRRRANIPIKHKHGPYANHLMQNRHRATGLPHGEYIIEGPPNPEDSHDSRLHQFDLEDLARGSLALDPDLCEDCEEEGSPERGRDEECTIVRNGLVRCGFLFFFFPFSLPRDIMLSSRHGGVQEGGKSWLGELRDENLER
jgi:hypothetical protein